MAAMLVNHFKLRRDVLTYNLSGMGCSSSLISVDLVKHLLGVRPLSPILHCFGRAGLSSCRPLRDGPLPALLLAGRA
jgi:hypothetical protein